MATIRELHYQFKLNMDRVDTQSNPDFNVAEIDWLLNEAQMVFLKQRSSSKSNPKRTGFEASQKRIDDLSTLVIKYPLQPGITPALDATSNVYELSISSFSFPYFQLVSIYADVTVNNCAKKIKMKFAQHDDYRVLLEDSFNKPSEEFILYNYGRSSLGSGSSIFIYPGTLSVTKVYPEYIKYPTRVSFGSYTYIDGVVYPEQTLEFPPHTHSEIVDIACQLASLNIENPEYIQLKNLKVNINE